MVVVREPDSGDDDGVSHDINSKDSYCITQAQKDISSNNNIIESQAGGIANGSIKDDMKDNIIKSKNEESVMTDFVSDIIKINDSIGFVDSTVMVKKDHHIGEGDGSGDNENATFILRSSPYSDIEKSDSKEIDSGDCSDFDFNVGGWDIHNDGCSDDNDDASGGGDGGVNIGVGHGNNTAGDGNMGSDVGDNNDYKSLIFSNSDKSCDFKERSNSGQSDDVYKVIGVENSPPPSSQTTVEGCSIPP